ncbi:SDR family oxidoreductase [Mesorhizobium sp. J428]|uniref:SDR family oxidoreductase n=1 Tax=Mesorhizobium sp. J428 TaxID=2898440 RepID=UPI002150A400|nr:SDR family oxidoreductase [Mesorhizobium sp. J428]MCR5860400.1 SDR family oxidoreductase [Mesorhizobium sp. J428]
MTAMQNGPFLVTGASGQLGGRVVELLLQAGARPVIATTRSVDKLSRLPAQGVEVRRADFTNPAGLKDAFAGAKRLLIISTDDLEPGKRLVAHSGAIEAAVAAGVEHIVYTSLTNPGADSPITFAVDHRETEALLVESGIPHTILRNNLYTDLFLMSAPQAIRSGQLFAATGQGRAGYVTREDCARAAAAALMHETETNTYDVTGPDLISQADLAAILSDLSGKAIAYVPITVDDLRSGMIANGLPPAMAEAFASFDEAIAKGHMAVSTNAVKDLTGKAPASVRDFLRKNAASLLEPGAA